MGEGGEGGEGGTSYVQFDAPRNQACSLIYVTCPSVEEARKIGRALVEQKLAAGANVLPGMESCYRWQGKIETASEAVLILKTGKDRVAAAIARVRELHSYSVPCAIELPVLSGDRMYLDWIRAETA